jgi:uncharacterized protein (TIGR02117 family)
LRQPADASLYPAKTDAVIVHVVDHGYHSGLIISRSGLADLAKEHGLMRLSAVLGVFEAFETVEIGWGEDHFYRSVPQASLAALPHVLRAMFNPANRSVVHVVGMTGAPEQFFNASSLLEVSISKEGLKRLSFAIDAELQVSLSGEVSPLGPGLYGPSGFFAGTSRYHLLNTCNHWVGQMLARAGLPYAPVEATFSSGLFYDLKRRSAAKVLR